CDDSLLHPPTLQSSHRAETTGTVLVIFDGAKKMIPPEFGPGNIREPQFTVRQLPQHEIADADLAAGADDQIGIRQARRVQIAVHDRFIHRILIHFARLDILYDPANGPEDFV